MQSLLGRIAEAVFFVGLWLGLAALLGDPPLNRATVLVSVVAGATLALAPNPAPLWWWMWWVPLFLAFCVSVVWLSDSPV